MCKEYLVGYLPNDGNNSQNPYFFCSEDCRAYWLKKYGLRNGKFPTITTLYGKVTPEPKCDMAKEHTEGSA